MEQILIAGFLGFLGILILLDVAMVVSLVRLGDERRQMIVWKASTWTLLGMTGGMIIDIIESLVRGQAVTANPFIQLGTGAILYFIILLYFRRRYGG
ncbi:hypothetical protein [Pseudoflavonifractor hominis]|uniref:Uncharacterized protein n=1 Tax=Pseudoflavonifractor hominis TaxID=2763059 RepID=A0ABR7HVF3_9FIRM|nr:hypothetical protein [Pseudoflavonifractor hominis]MBC5731411.1 hypothetical protein [Pseudoflavonifractor hominis]